MSLLTILSLIVFLHILFWKATTKLIIRKYDGSVRLVYLLNVLLLLPCIYFAYQDHLHFFYRPDTVPLDFLFITYLCLRFFLFPHIYSLLLTLEYFKYLKTKNFPVKDVVLFIVLLLLCIISLLAMERIFGTAVNAAMSV